MIGNMLSIIKRKWLDNHNPHLFLCCRQVYYITIPLFSLYRLQFLTFCFWFFFHFHRFKNT